MLVSIEQFGVRAECSTMAAPIPDPASLSYHDTPVVLSGNVVEARVNIIEFSALHEISEPFCAYR